MKRTMFIGAIACGKTTLTQRLEHQQIRYNKTQAVEFTSNIIDTPGEYMEHHNMMSTLRVTSMDADIVVLLQSAVDKRLVFPAGFCSMFSKPTIGVITKIDLTQLILNIQKNYCLVPESKRLSPSPPLKISISINCLQNLTNQYPQVIY